MQLNRLILILFSLLFKTAIAQNLVQNGDFNLTQPGSHSAFNSTLHLMDYWRDQDTNSAAGCATIHQSMCGNPLTIKDCPGASSSTQGFKLPYPYSGLGMARSIFIVEPIWLNAIPSDSRISNARNELSDPLVEDTLYCTELHVMLFTEPSFLTNMDSLCWTHDGLGMYFSDSAYLPSNRPWDDGIVPQVGGWGYITNDTSWRKLKGSFVADGGEQYLFIGNYSPLSSPMLQVHFQNCYPYVDYGSLWFDAVYVYNCRDTLFQVVQKDTTVCYGQSVWLNPQVQGFKLQDSITTYTWQTPNGTFTTTQAAYLANSPGQYTLTAIINKRFTATTNFTVTWREAEPLDTLLPDSVGICPGQPTPVVVPVFADATYLWSNGATTRYTTVLNPGTYSVTIQNPCWQHTEQVEVFYKNCGDRIFIPTAFTPDGDGTNDYFAFEGPRPPIKLSVFDRWGKMVYYSANYQNNWDGTYQGQDVEAGVYTYLIEYLYVNPNATQPDQKGSPQQIRGVVTIIR